MRRSDGPNPTDASTNISSSDVARSGVVLKSQSQIESMRGAGLVAANALTAARVACRIGASTRDIAEVAGQAIDAAGAEAIFRGYRMDGAPPFGAAACVSVNDEIVHGLPGDRRLASGDVVTVDVGVRLSGWCADAATSVVVGGATAGASRLIEAGERALDEILAKIQPGVRWSEASEAGDRIAREAGLLTLRGWAGHGIGRCLHEAPALPMRPRFDQGENAVFEEGMTLAIEPILALPPSGVDPRAYADGSYTFGSAVQKDGWTVVSLDGWLTCHFEHTIAVSSRGAVVLTAA